MIEDIKKLIPNIENIEIISQSQNIVFKGIFEKSNIIIRCSQDSWRSNKDIEIELKYLRFLEINGFNVCKPIKINGKYINKLFFNKNQWYFVVFEKIDGVPLFEYGFKNNILTKIGNYIGKMHALNSGSNDFKNYYRFIEDRDIELLEQYIKIDEYEKFKRIKKEKDIILHENKNFGLIHSDIHTGNILIFDNNIFLIDFDNLRCGWYISDILNILYEIYMYNKKSAPQLEQELWKGYLEYKKIDRASMKVAKWLIMESDIWELVMIRKRGKYKEIESKRYNLLTHCVNRFIPSFEPVWSFRVY